MAIEQPFRFLDLPTEIRLSIYELAFENSVIVLLSSRKAALPHILKASRGVYNEAIEVFYSVARFYVSLGIHFRWYSRLPPRLRKAITCLRHYHPITKEGDVHNAIEAINQFRHKAGELGAQLRPGVLTVRVKLINSVEEIWTDDPWTAWRDMLNGDTTVKIRGNEIGAQ